MTPHQVIQAIIDAGVKGDLHEAEVLLHEYVKSRINSISGHPLPEPDNDVILHIVRKQRGYYDANQKQFYVRTHNGKMATKSVLKWEHIH